MKIAACCMTRNEERDIVEWALYHAWTGFDSIIIFENRSTDSTRERLDALRDIIDIRIFDWQYEYHPGHYLAFQTCAEKFRDEFDWIAFFDHDEFFVPIRDQNVRDYLSSMDEHASIAINWAMYGSSGHVEYPDCLVTQAFVHRAPLNLSANRHVKSIVRPREIVGCTNSHIMDLQPGVPRVDSKGQSFEWIKPGKMKAASGLEDIARFHHYFVRSWAHWQKRMAIPFNAQKRKDQSFEDHDFNEVYDPIVVTKFGPVLDKIQDVKMQIASKIGS